jgi:molybdopterin converting factor small subunit
MAMNIHVEFKYSNGDSPVMAEKIGLNATKWQMEAANVREVLAKLIELSPDPELLRRYLYNDEGALRYYWTIRINVSPVFGGRLIRWPQELDVRLKDGDKIIFGPGV